MKIKEIFDKLSRKWDPRPSLAKEWLTSAQKYEESLRSNKHLNPEIIDAILQERNRIHCLFQELLPDHKEKISIVITNEAQVEHCAIFSWNDHIYVLVSAVMIARPIDHPEANGIKGWDWLAHHEITHLKSGHLPWLFHTRRVFRLSTLFLYTTGILFYICPPISVIASLFYLSRWIFLAAWITQMLVSLVFEYKADIQATRSTKDPQVLEDAEKTISRMSLQALNRLRPPFGWLNYIGCTLFVDPHPPLPFRRWLLRKHARLLKKTVSIDPHAR